MKLKQQEVIVGEFENECYAEIEKRDLERLELMQASLKISQMHLYYFQIKIKEYYL